MTAAPIRWPASPSSARRIWTRQSRWRAGARISTSARSKSRKTCKCRWAPIRNARREASHMSASDTLKQAGPTRAFWLGFAAYVVPPFRSRTSGICCCLRRCITTSRYTATTSSSRSACSPCSFRERPSPGSIRVCSPTAVPCSRPALWPRDRASLLVVHDARGRRKERDDLGSDIPCFGDGLHVCSVRHRGSPDRPCTPQLTRPEKRRR